MATEYTLDPQVRAFLDSIADKPQISDFPVPEGRRLFAKMMDMVRGTPAEVKSTEDLIIPGPPADLPARLYRPPQTLRDPAPVLLYFHGGGWTIGSVDTHDAICRALCAHSGCGVVSVDYRMGPEHQFPAAVDDAWAATCWLAREARQLELDPGRIAVGGDSAGGNLAAAVTLLARAAQAPRIAYQLLIYPATENATDTASRLELATGYRLTKALMDWFSAQYFATPADCLDPRGSPMRASSLAGLPPAYVLTAGFDPLRDEGEAYATRLRAEGVPAEYVCFGGMIHGFFGMAGIIDQAGVAQRHAAAALRAALVN
jgi:acetyl esterase